MNGLIVVGCWIVGGTLAGLVLWKGLRASWFEVKKTPPVRINHELLAQMRSEIIHDASKRIVRADFQRGYRR